MKIIEQSGASLDMNGFLQRPLIAHLATGSPNGPCESPVWFIWEQGAVWIVGTTSDSFPKRIEAESRCALGFVDFDLERGLLQHVGMRGTATVGPLDGERLYRLLSRYLSPDSSRWRRSFQEEVVDRLDLMIRFDPLSVVVRDQSYFK
jgi:hypothetical protein